MDFRIVDAPLLIGLVEAAGGRIACEGAEVAVRLPVEGRRPEFAERLRQAWGHAARLKPELLDLLDGSLRRRRAASRSALLREGVFAPTAAPCAFPIGPHSGDACHRCAAPMAAHYALPSAGLTATSPAPYSAPDERRMA